MTMVELLSRRKRTLLICAAALGVGGYASYRIYKSSYVSWKRQRLSAFLASISTLIRVFSDGVDSTSVIASDVKAYLLSDVDEVPGSVKQCLKIMRCKEFQEAITAISVCVSRGFMANIVLDHSLYERPSSRRRLLRTQSSGVCTMSEDESNGNHSDKHVLTEEIHQEIHQDRSFGRNSSKEGLPERLMQKLFSEPGKGFASVVLGSVAKNTTLTFLEGLSKMKRHENEWNSRSLAPETYVGETLRPGSPEETTILDLASSSKGRALVAECIRTFVGTAVSVYLDKTKGVNIYEEVVAGMTKPTYQPAVKDLLTTICNGAVETLVRTSHEVLTSPPDGNMTVPKDLARVEEVSLTLKDVQSNGKLGEITLSDGEASSSSRAVADVDPRTMVIVSSNRMIMTNLVDGLSRTLAVPSNRRLLIDVAGTVTSEAIHSFFEVFCGIVSPYLRGNMKYTKPVRNAVEHERQVEETWVLLVSRELISRSLVIMTVCFAILLHVVVDLGLVGQ